MTLQGPSMPSPGSVILGRFRIESVLGEGGMGIVFGARRIPSDERVAIKVLLPEATAHPEAVPRFINEARATMKLMSAHVVKVYEAGTLDIGLPFIVMELLEGTDLAVLLEKQGKLPVTTAVDYVIQACDAIAEAHALGIVHRDLKPSNLFLYERAGAAPLVKVLDFGISKMANAQNQSLTATGTFLGSPHYMPPEQLKSARDVDARADMWALGVILYELLSGQPPFDARAFGELFMRVLTAEFTPLRTLRPEVPEGVEQVVARCLRRPRDERYRDLVELAQALAPFASPDGARSAQNVGKPKVAAPAPAPPRRTSALASTALMLDRPHIPGLLQGTGGTAAMRPSSPSFPASTPQPSRPIDTPRASYAAPPSLHGPGGPIPTPRGGPPSHLSQSQGSAPFSYNAPQAPEPPRGSSPPNAPRGSSPPEPPRRMSPLVVGLVIGALVIAVVGAVLIGVAMRARHSAPSPTTPMLAPSP